MCFITSERCRPREEEDEEAARGKVKGLASTRVDNIYFQRRVSREREIRLSRGLKKDSLWGKKGDRYCLPVSSAREERADAAGARSFAPSSRSCYSCFQLSLVLPARVPTLFLARMRETTLYPTYEFTSPSGLPQPFFLPWARPFSLLVEIE